MVTHDYPTCKWKFYGAPVGHLLSKFGIKKLIHILSVKVEAKGIHINLEISPSLAHF